MPIEWEMEMARAGRPKIGEEKRKRVNLMLKPRTYEYLKKVGDGNASMGVYLITLLHMAGALHNSVERPSKTGAKMTAGVYLLLKAGEVVYVGQSRNVERRLTQHRGNKVDFDERQIIEVPATDLKKVEQQYILKHRPALNGRETRYGGKVFFDSSGEARTIVERQREFRARMKSLGYTRRKIWVHPDDFKKFRRFVRCLQRKRMENLNYVTFMKDHNPTKRIVSHERMRKVLDRLSVRRRLHQVAGRAQRPSLHA